MGGQQTDVMIHARDLLATRERLNEILAFHTGKPTEQIHIDTERDNILSRRRGRELRHRRRHHAPPRRVGRLMRAAGSIA